MTHNKAAIVLAAGAYLSASGAVAYVGPGAGLTLLSALWGLVVAVLVALSFVVLWPYRRWRRRRQTLHAELAAAEKPGNAGDHRNTGGPGAEGH